VSGPVQPLGEPAQQPLRGAGAVTQATAQGDVVLDQLTDFTDADIRLAAAAGQVTGLVVSHAAGRVGGHRVTFGQGRPTFHNAVTSTDA
jgi:hypothetical protein